MKRLFFNFLALVVSAIVCSGFTVSQTIKKSDKAVAEITVLRQNLLNAIKTGDRKTLESIYADDFTHTHASGQVDNKQKRINVLLSGGRTIETGQVNEINIRVYNKVTAIAIGESTVVGENQIATKNRWTIVYVKSGNRWQIAASQATKLAKEQ